MSDDRPVDGSDLGRAAGEGDGSRVRWREWGAEAFDEAGERGDPVCCFLTATWCGPCHEMAVETFGEPRVAANVNDGFVPVRVDVDRYPRVRERYNAGGFPSTAFLTPDGRLLTGATYLGPDGMRQVLDRVRDRWAESGAGSGRVPRALAGEPTPAGEVTERIEAHLAGQLGEKYDPEFAGWGTDAKFPLPRTIEFALKREREQAVATLDAVARALHDDVEGGFFRFASHRNWGDPHREKLLADNAALVRAFANGYLYTGETRFRETAADAIDFLTASLWNGTAFGGSQGPAEDREYYGLDAEERAAARAPRRDLTAYADANAAAADALLVFAAYTDDDGAREYARRTLGYLRRELIDDGAVVHYRDGDERGEAGLLTDQAGAAAAFARAAQVLGSDVRSDGRWTVDGSDGGESDGYLSTARAVAEHAIETLRDEGSFRDGPAEGPGLLDRPLRPIDGNVEMASALLDLAALTGDGSYRSAARETVGAFAGAWDRIGVQIAGYGAVAGRLCRPDLVIDVDRAGSDLHRAALRVADHEKVVRPGVTDAGVAQIRVGDRSREAGTPPELMDAVSGLSTGP